MPGPLTRTRRSIHGDHVAEQRTMRDGVRRPAASAAGPRPRCTGGAGMSTVGSPYGETPPTDDAAVALDVRNPHEPHWFKVPPKEVGPKFVGGLVFAQLVFFIPL